MACFYCGYNIESLDYSYCPHCGYKLYEPQVYNSNNKGQNQLSKSLHFEDKKDYYETDYQNEKGFIANIFSIHPRKELHHLLRNCESKLPILQSDYSIKHLRPWIFTRVFLILFFLFSLLFICTHIFSNVYTIPAFIIVGAFVFPVTIMVFLWELDIARNISFQNLLIIMLIGGICSLFLTISIYEVIPKLSDSAIVEAISVALIEEYSKLIIIAYFVKRMRITLIINGIIIGAAIGTGFGAFESAGYAYNIGAKLSLNDMLINLLDRAWLSLGMHIVWCAFAGAIIVYIMDKKPFSVHRFFSLKFHSLFLIPVTLHAFWNIPFPNWSYYFTKFHLLIISAWLFLYVFLKKGINQIETAQIQYFPSYEETETLSE